MNYNHLRSFYSVAKNKSFTRASEDLNISQSTISIQVIKLEHYLNYPLFKRNKKNAELTKEGHFLFAYAESIFSLEDKIESAFNELNSLRSGTLKIGIIPIVPENIIPDIIYRIRNKYQDIDIKLFTGSSKEVLNKVIDFEYHVGIIVRGAYPDNLIYREISKHKIYFITNNNKLKDNINLDDLADYPLILQGKGAICRDVIINAFKTRHIPLNLHMEIDDPSVVMTMVEKGIGGAFMPLFAIEEQIDQGKFRCIDILDGIYLSFDVVFLQERRKCNFVQAVLSTFKEV